MAFIPIDAKADLQGQKKGKITPAQHAILNAWSLASKTGILDFPQDHAKKGRCETDTLNITNIQQNETEIIFNKGYLVICGRLVECEDGTKFTFNTPITGKETGKIIARFSLGASGNEEFKIIQKTGSLIQPDDDLNDNPVNGEYELELYSYEAYPTSATLTRTQPYIPDLGGKLKEFEASLKDEGKPLHGYDDTKGTIEERLTALGFKEGSIALPNGTATVNNVTRQGNYVIGELVAVLPKTSNLDNIGFIVGTLDDNFKPIKDYYCYGFGNNGAGSRLNYYQMQIKFLINTQGQIIVNELFRKETVTAGSSGIDGKVLLTFGFEAPPITN